MSYVYSIAGHQIQEFGENTKEDMDFEKYMSRKNKTKKPKLKYTIDGKPILVQRKGEEMQNQDQIKEDQQTQQYIYDQNELQAEQQYRQPNDLGPEYFKTLQERFYEQNKVTTHDPKVLFDFWKLKRKRFLTIKKARSMNRSMGMSMSSNSQIKTEYELFWETILDSHPLDVEYTLNQEGNRTKDTALGVGSTLYEAHQREKDRRRKMEEEKYMQRFDTERRKEAQDRLYQGKKKAKEYEIDRIKREKEEKKLEKQRQNDLQYQEQLQKQKEIESRIDFVNKVIKAHKQMQPEVENYRTVEKLFSFYESLTEQEKEELEFSEEENDYPLETVEDMINIYFTERAEDFKKMHKAKQGYYTDNIEDVLMVWNNKTMPLEKEKYFLDFEDEDNVRECLERHNEMLQEQKEKEQMQKDLEQEQREIEERNKIEQVQQNMEEQAALLSQPKDRLKLGKDILLLKQMFPNDKILRKIMLQEFRDTRMAKMPEEYDVYDSDEENAIKERNKFVGKITLKEIDKPDREKEQQLKEMFTQMLDKYRQEKEEKMHDDQEKLKKQKDNDANLNRFLNRKAKEFIEWRKQRFDKEPQEKDIDSEFEQSYESHYQQKQQSKQQDCKTLKKFLSETYKEMLSKPQLREASQRNFPFLKYGESKNLQKRSFPSSFKRKFFVIVKQYIREQYGAGNRDKHEKLPFWAPGGDGARCRIHDKIDCPKDCKYVTTNKKIFDLMGNIINQKKWEQQMYVLDKLIERAQRERNRDEEEEYKEKKQKLMLKRQREQISAWVDDKFIKEKENIMLTYSDAANCTFVPDIHVPREERSLKKWVDDLGENLLKKQPRIYKLGVMKQCQILIEKKKYLEAYEKLRETFNIEEIKERIAQERGLKYEMISDESVYVKGKKESAEALKKKMKNENFEDPRNKNILLDVYNMVTFLEDYEKSILKKQKEIEQMIQQDPFAPKNPLHSQSLNMNNSDEDFRKTLNASFSTYASRRQTVKSYMCPLGKNCPRALEQGRWPQSETASIVPLGVQCEFAHTYTELKFEQELKSKKHMLQNYLQSLKAIKNPDFKFWNPAGADFQQCKGCNFKCGMCQLRGKNMEKISKILKKKIDDRHFLKEMKLKEKEIEDQQKQQSINQKQKVNKSGQGSSALQKFAVQMAVQMKKKDKVRYEKLKKQENKSKQIIQQKMEEEKVINLKQGFLQKANTLFQQERYSEAFNIIAKAVHIVKRELEEKEIEDQKEDDYWKKELDLPQGETVTQEIVYQTLNKKLNADDENKGQILYFYAQKRGIIGPKKIDVNQFLNIQIEECYVKIESKLNQKEKDIALMKKKIEKLEDKNKKQPDETSEIDSKNICPNIRDQGFCPDFEKETQERVWQHQGWENMKGKQIKRKCKYAHIPLELDLQQTDQKIQGLNQSIQIVQQQIENSLKPEPYRPPSAHTVLLTPDQWREQEMQRKLGKKGGAKHISDIDKTHRETIWNKDVDHLTIPFHERTKKKF